MKRRSFLQGVAAAPLAETWISSVQGDGRKIQVSSAGTGSSDGRKDPEWVLRVRDQMPVTREMTYFQTGSFGPSPIPVVDRVRELMEHQLKGPAALASIQQLQQAEDACRPLLAPFLGAREEEVALTHNTTEGMNIVLWSVNWSPGDEIIISIKSTRL